MRETNGTPWTTSELPFSVSIREARLVALSTPIELGARFPGLAEAPIWGDGAWLAMPVHDDGVVVGAVGAIFDQSRSFDQDYLMAAQRAGDRLGALLGEEQVRRVSASRRLDRTTRAALARLQAVTAALAGAATVQEVSDVVLSNAVEALGASSGGLSLRRGESVVVVSSENYPKQLIDAYREQPLWADMPSPTVIRSGEPLFMESAADWADRYPAVHASADFVFETATAIAPITGHDEVLGALALSFAQPRVFSADERNLPFVLRPGNVSNLATKQPVGIVGVDLVVGPLALAPKALLHVRLERQVGVAVEPPPVDLGERLPDGAEAAHALVDDLLELGEAALLRGGVLPGSEGDGHGAASVLRPVTTLQVFLLALLGK
ncbi:MAG TPA: GAF domain-containing protein [Gaiellales bacterium]|nr:GAF domain-containing protein [Gaiellales bacterium]